MMSPHFGVPVRAKYLMDTEDPDPVDQDVEDGLTHTHTRICRGNFLTFLGLALSYGISHLVSTKGAMEGMRSFFRRRTAASYVAILTAPAISIAAPIITVGHHTLAPNTPNQVIPIMVEGGDPVQGVNLIVQIGDGGASLGGVAGSAPRIQDVSFAGGAIFAANNNGRALDEPATDQLWQIHTATADGTVAADGVLAFITIDTTGFTSGTYPLLLADIGGDANVDSDFAGIPATISNGSVTVTVPEPVLLGAAPVLALGFVRHRKGPRSGRSGL
jgi:hypothetical protein